MNEFDDFILMATNVFCNELVNWKQGIYPVCKSFVKACMWLWGCGTEVLYSERSKSLGFVGSRNHWKTHWIKNVITLSSSGKATLASQGRGGRCSPAGGSITQHASLASYISSFVNGCRLPPLFDGKEDSGWQTTRASSWKSWFSSLIYNYTDAQNIGTLKDLTYTNYICTKI